MKREREAYVHLAQQVVNQPVCHLLQIVDDRLWRGVLVVHTEDYGYTRQRPHDLHLREHRVVGHVHLISPVAVADDDEGVGALAETVHLMRARVGSQDVSCVNKVRIGLSSRHVVLGDQQTVERLLRSHDGRNALKHLEFVPVLLSEIRENCLLQDANRIQRLLVDVRSNLLRNRRCDVVPLVLLDQFRYVLRSHVQRLRKLSENRRWGRGRMFTAYLHLSVFEIDDLIGDASMGRRENCPFLTDEKRSHFWSRKRVQTNRESKRYNTIIVQNAGEAAFGSCSSDRTG